MPRLLKLIALSLLAGACHLVLEVPEWQEGDAGTPTGAGDAGTLQPGPADAAVDHADAAAPGADAATAAPDAGACRPSAQSCQTTSECCPGLGCSGGGSCQSAPDGLPVGFRCEFNGQCSSGYCKSARCTDPDPENCRGAGSACNVEDCCTGLLCDPALVICTVPERQPCLYAEMCETRNCANGFCAGCRGVGSPCEENISCCSGNCSGGVCADCRQAGASCDLSSDWAHCACCGLEGYFCSASCDSGTGQCLPP